MDSTDESCLHTGYEPKNYDLIQPQFSEQRFLEDVDYDGSALEEMLHNALRVHVYHSQREGLSVSRRRPCPNDQGDPLWREQGDLL